MALADLDSLLEESELRDAKQAFWRRYRLRFPAEVHPSDAVVSRVSRELSKRMLCLFNVWKVHSLQFQLGTSQKKRRLGDGLFTEEAETEESYTADCDTYLNKLHTLLIAYSLAGCQPIPGVADAAKEQTLGADSTEYVEVPLDTMLQYFYRAKRAVSGLPVNKRLAWLQARDSDERSEWVTRAPVRWGQSLKSLWPVGMPIGSRMLCQTISRWPRLWGGPQARVRIQVPAGPGYQWQANREADGGWPAPLRRIQQGHVLQQELRQWGTPLLCDPAR